MQGRADRINLAAFQAGGSDLTDEQREEMLKEKVRQIEIEIHKYHPKSRERNLLGKQKMILQAELHEIKKKRPRFPGIAQLFMEEAKRQLPREVYAKIEEGAKHIHGLRNKPKANQQLALEVGKVIERMNQA